MTVPDNKWNFSKFWSFCDHQSGQFSFQEIVNSKPSSTWNFFYIPGELKRNEFKMKAENNSSDYLSLQKCSEPKSCDSISFTPEFLDREFFL